MSAKNGVGFDRSHLCYLVLVMVILLAAIGLRVFKAVHTGILYDEVYTVWNFGQSFHDALTSYKNPNNNHIFNSILINADRVLFAGQEYYYRFHTILFGGLYCCAATYLVFGLISAKGLRIALVLLLTLQWFVFDLSFLARGYSIALAAVFGGLALLVLLLKRKIRFSRVWLPVGILTMMNFLAMGSMLSVLLLLCVINICYIFFFSHRVFDTELKPFKSIGIHLPAVTGCSGLLLYLLYQYIYKDILAARTTFGKMPLWQHLKEVLWVNMAASKQHWAQGVYAVFLLATAAALGYAIYRLLRSRRPSDIPFLNPSTPQAFILWTMVLFFAGMVFYRNVLKMSLGYPRNGVFLTPLFLLSCGIILDTAVSLMPTDRIRRVFAGIVCGIIVAVTAAAAPSLYAVKVYNWEIQSIAGPLIGDLKKIDPHRRWKIALTQQTWHMNLPLQYYQLTGQPIQRAAGPDFDVIVVHESEAIPVEYWFREGFYDDFECKVAFSPAVQSQYHLQRQ